MVFNLEISDKQANILIEGLQKKFGERKVAKTTLRNKKFENLMKLNDNELEYCILYMKQMGGQEKTNTLINIIDYFTDCELKNEKLRTIFSNFKEELKTIV